MDQLAQNVSSRRARLLQMQGFMQKGLHHFQREIGTKRVLALMQSCKCAKKHTLPVAVAELCRKLDRVRRTAAKPSREVCRARPNTAAPGATSLRAQHDTHGFRMEQRVQDWIEAMQSCTRAADPGHIPRLCADTSVRMVMQIGLSVMH